MGASNHTSANSSHATITLEDANLKQLIAHHCKEFVGCYLKEQAENLSSLWEFVKRLPVPTLEHDLGVAGAGTALGLASTSSNLLGIISTITWMVKRLDLEANQEQGFTDMIVREAMPCGCSVALSHLLARYWEEHRNKSKPET